MFIHEDDHRIHGKFNQTVTATGRISSTEPNLQNIPARVELGRLIRKVFVPEEGYVFVDADYSQIELRVLAHCSGDAALIEAYREAKDIHRITASQVFHTPFYEVTDLQCIFQFFQPKNGKNRVYWKVLVAGHRCCEQ